MKAEGVIGAILKYNQGRQLVFGLIMESIAIRT